MINCIYREQAIEVVDKRIEELRTHEAFNRKTQGEIIDLSGVKTYLLALPAADVVPIVRCKDCIVQRTCRIAQWLGMDGYCSQGERGKDNEYID